MTTIELQFLANRYHGTAWGRHVNEGVAEWPPSPYRLLRALYDAWKRKCTELTEPQVARILEALAGRPPWFWLPKAVASHTRSYLNINTEDASDKSLIFDGFLAFAPQSACFLHWDMSLSDEDRRNLATLLGSLNYLGRSESWIEGRLVHQPGSGFVCEPAVAGGRENVTLVACAIPPADFKRKGSWLGALSYSSGQMLKDRVSQPPAMRYVPYSLPSQAVTTWLPMRSAGNKRNLSAAIVELHGNVLPMNTDAIRIAERVRGRLMRYFQRKGEIPAIVHGKDERGLPLKEKHTHLFILPRANAAGRIDHVLLFTTNAQGFVDGLADAIAQMKMIVWIEPIRVVASWMGRSDDFQVRPLARIVRSSTPFATVRHWRKGRGSMWNFIENEVRRECCNHGLPRPAEVQPFHDLRPERFRRSREGDPSVMGYDIGIRFAEPVQTPFALGYGCHFGLGQFEKV